MATAPTMATATVTAMATAPTIATATAMARSMPTATV